MNTKACFKVGGFMAALLVVEAPLPVLAHEVSGVSLAADALAADYYQVNCTGKTQTFFIELTKISGTPPIRAQVMKPSKTGNQSVQLAATEASGTPSAATLAQKKGIYNVLVFKGGVGAVSYSLTMHCLKKDGAEVDGAEPFLVSDE